MKGLALCLAVLAGLAAGCATQPSVSYYDQVMGRPLPATQAERDQECASLRREIARQQSLGSYGMATAGNPMMALAFQSAAADNIATLNARASQAQCSAAFGSQTVIQRGGFDRACYDTCKAGTNRTSDQCFDACNK